MVDPHARSVGRKSIPLDRAIFLKGEYTFRQLHRWRLALRQLFVTERGSVVSLDVDDRKNRITIGITSEASESRILAQVSALAIPSAAVALIQEEHETAATTLQNYFGPKMGGIQIVRSGSFGAGDGECTIGINVRYTALGYKRGFVTASHCTNLFGGEEATGFYSPERFNDHIADEISDPPFSSALDGCPLGARCRYSDAALASYDAEDIWNGAVIARTEYDDPLSGSLVIEEIKPNFTVTGWASPMVGSLVDKIGRTTGWTWGQIQTVCQDVEGGPYGPSDYLLLCQARADAGLQGGDSGAAVFYWDGFNSATIVGIARGFANGLMTFSHFEDVRAELGYQPWQIAGF